jgi:hypothetical protein
MAVPVNEEGIDLPVQLLTNGISLGTSSAQRRQHAPLARQRRDTVCNPVALRFADEPACSFTAPRSTAKRVAPAAT